jgi:hypothetical protein
MGIFHTKNKGSGNKIQDLKHKIGQLRAAGMVSSAERLETQLRMYETSTLKEKVKPLSPVELKRQVAGAKATGQAK